MSTLIESFGALFPSTPAERNLCAEQVSISLPPQCNRLLMQYANDAGLGRSHFVVFLLAFYREHMEEIRALCQPFPLAPSKRGSDQAPDLGAEDSKFSNTARTVHLPASLDAYVMSEAKRRKGGISAFLRETIVLHRQMQPLNAERRNLTEGATR